MRLLLRWNQVTYTPWFEEACSFNALTHAKYKRVNENEIVIDLNIDFGSFTYIIVVFPVDFESNCQPFYSSTSIQHTSDIIFKYNYSKFSINLINIIFFLFSSILVHMRLKE